MKRSNSRAARAAVLVFSCALLMTGGGAVASHTGGGRLVKQFQAPYASDGSRAGQSCGGCGLSEYFKAVLLQCKVETKCRFDASADKTNGKMSITGSVEPILPLSLGGSGLSDSWIVDGDGPRPAGSAWAVRFHVDRLRLYDGAGHASAKLRVMVEDQDFSAGGGCCVDIAELTLFRGQEGHDMVVNVELVSPSPYPYVITARLFGSANQTEPLTLGSHGPSFDVQVTLTGIDVFE